MISTIANPPCSFRALLSNKPAAAGSTTRRPAARCGAAISPHSSASRVNLECHQNRCASSSTLRVATETTGRKGRRLQQGRSLRLACRASSDAASAASGAPKGEDGDDAKSDLTKTLVLGALFCGWYAFNIVFNIYNKQVLKAYPFPMTATLCQFAVGVLFVAILWGTGLHKMPKNLSKKTLIAIAPLALVHTIGNLLTNVSLGKVAVSFTHTIKAMEPFFSVILSSIFLGDTPSLLIMLTLVPIVGGVALASITEVSFNWIGFAAAMGSNITFQSRNVLSKKIMGGEKPMDNINLFSVITVMSLLFCLPITVFFEGVMFTPAAVAAYGLHPVTVVKRTLAAGFCFHAYQQVSYMILQRVSPVTHSVGNCVKRVVVIIASVIFFQNPVSPLNGIGTAIALTGVFAYSQIKRMETANKKKADAALAEAKAA